MERVVVPLVLSNPARIGNLPQEVSRLAVGYSSNNMDVSDACVLEHRLGTNKRPRAAGCAIFHSPYHEEQILEHLRPVFGTPP